MLVHRARGGLYDKHIRATHILLNLDVSFPIFESCDLGLVASQSQKLADIICQPLIGGAAEDLEFVIHARALRLALRLLVGARVDLLIRRCRKSCHKFALSFWLPASARQARS